MTHDPTPASLVPRRYRTEGTARAARARRAARLSPVLDRLLAARDPARDLAADPVRFVHAYDDPADQEIAGLVASSLAYGNVVAVRASVQRVLASLGPRPSRAVTGRSRDRLQADLAGFVHRWTGAEEMAALLSGAGNVLEREGRLGAVIERAYSDHGDLRRAAGALSNALLGPAPGRRLAYLFPDATGAGAMKRLHLYLRWMVRGPDGVDLGLWRLPTSALLIPLDTHTSRICRYIGLTRRNDASWRTAEEVTWNLRALDPEDPVRYDFALAHLGISKDCRHRRDADVCPGCALVEVCRI